MGSILSTRVKEGGKVVFEIALDMEEVQQLQGHINNIHVIAEDSPKTPSNLAHRGKNEATKYFLIPRQLRKELNYQSKAFCQRIDSKNKTVFVYVMDRFSV